MSQEQPLSSALRWSLSHKLWLLLKGLGSTTTPSLQPVVSNARGSVKSVATAVLSALAGQPGNI